MKLRICSSFRPTSPYPGGNCKLPGWPPLGAKAGRKAGRPEGGAPKSPGALEGGTVVARIAGLGELVALVETTGSPHLDFLGSCFLASSMIVSPISLGASSVLLPPSSSNQPLFLHSVWKTKALAASLVSLGKSPRSSLGAASKCFNKILLVWSVKFS